ncbi:MAG: phosphoribosyltransferase [Promethearchaeota archaeon]
MESKEAEGRKHRVLSWQDYDGLEKRLLNDINHFFKENMIKKVNFVIGIYSGGVVLSKSVSTKLGNIPLIFLKLPAREGDVALFFGDKGESLPENSTDNDVNVLLVDDISDSGNTFKKSIKILRSIFSGRIITAALIFKEYSSFKPDINAFVDESNDWIVFPWE